MVSARVERKQKSTICRHHRRSSNQIIAISNELKNLADQFFFAGWFKSGVSNSSELQGHIPKEKCSAGRFVMEKAHSGLKLPEKMSNF